MKGVRFYCSAALLALLAVGQPVAAETTFRGDGNGDAVYRPRACLKDDGGLTRVNRAYGWIQHPFMLSRQV